MRRRRLPPCARHHIVVSISALKPLRRARRKSTRRPRPRFIRRVGSPPRERRTRSGHRARSPRLRFAIMRKEAISRPALHPNCPGCGALAPPEAATCPRCGRTLPQRSTTTAAAGKWRTASGNAGSPRDTTHGGGLRAVLPRRWTPADPNGARRWGPSFGTGLVLFVVISVCGAYMAIDEYGDTDAWNRASIARPRRAAAASEAAAQNVLPASPAELVASLEAQIASAHAESAADADRLRQAQISQRHVREQRRMHAGAKSAASAAAPATPTAARRPITRSPPVPDTQIPAASPPVVTVTPDKSTPIPPEATMGTASPSTSSTTLPSPPTSGPDPAAALTSAPAAHPHEQTKSAPPAEKTHSVESKGATPAGNVDFAHPPLLRGAPTDTLVASDTRTLPPRTSGAASDANPPTTRPLPSTESPPLSPDTSCGSEHRESACAGEPAAQPATAEPRDAARNGSWSGPIERPAPASSGDAQPSKPPASPAPFTSSPAAKAQSHSSGTQLTNAKHGGGTARHVNSSRRHHPPRPSTTHTRLLAPLFTLPHFLSTLLPAPLLPPVGRPPSHLIDLSDNQRALYRGH